MSSALLPLLLLLGYSTLCWSQGAADGGGGVALNTPMARNILPSPVKFDSFTGKITKYKVRLRLHPNYDDAVLRELNLNDYVVVLGESNDFYAIQPPEDIRGYVFRSYILDNVVEGDRVNIRLQPDRGATILGQLRAGDRVEVNPATSGHKWLQIQLPPWIHFYVAKEYIEKVGDAGFKERLNQKRQAAYDLLNITDAMSRVELQQPFDQMGIAGIKANYQRIINDYSDFPEATEKAKLSLVAIQEIYTAKKIAYLEEQSRLASAIAEANKALNAELYAQRNKMAYLQQQIEQHRPVATPSQSPIKTPPPPKKLTQVIPNISLWLPIEDRLFSEWSQQNGHRSPQDFYETQRREGFALKGIIDPYTRPVKNRPGDYMLLNSESKLPIAFLYSTHINLQESIGREVSIIVSPRKNNNFAFPAYFVLSVE